MENMKEPIIIVLVVVIVAFLTIIFKNADSEIANTIISMLAAFTVGMLIRWILLKIFGDL